MYATFDDSVTFEKTLSVTATTTDLECSFAGGCTYSVEAEGLYATLLDSENYISMCGQLCTLRDDLSSASAAVCELPHLATTYSVDTYTIV